jgi:hypothetical protein
MATRRLFVSPSGDEWIVQWEGGDAPSKHRTQAEAITAARALLGRSGDGDDPQIIVQGVTGQPTASREFIQIFSHPMGSATRLLGLDNRSVLWMGRLAGNGDNWTVRWVEIKEANSPDNQQ